MSITNKNVYNLNNLSGNSFILTINKFPNVTFTIQEVELPGVDLPPKKMSSPVGYFNTPGDKLTYHSLNIKFLVDESLNNWREIYNWMRQLAPTNVGEGYDQVSQYTTRKSDDIRTTAILTLLTNNLNLNLKITYNDLIPISLGDLNLATTDSDNRIITCSASFVYDYYDIEVNAINNTDGYVENNKIL